MEILSSTLNHIAVLFSFILIGFVLKKKNIYLTAAAGLCHALKTEYLCLRS